MNWIKKKRKRWKETIKKYEIKSENAKPKTFDELCLEVLKKLNKKQGPVPAKVWTGALGYKHQNSLVRVINRVKKNCPEKLKIYKDRRPRLYEAI